MKCTSMNEESSISKRVISKEDSIDVEDFADMSSENSCTSRMEYLWTYTGNQCNQRMILMLEALRDLT